MRCEFSEFSYGFALTHEIVTTLQSSLTAAPVMPSLGKEGLLGYDLLMDGLEGWTYAAQFKIPERLTRSTATEWGSWGREYMRFHTRSHGDQHELLLALEQASVFNIVEYVCPCFSTAGEFNQAFTRTEIESRSIKLRPSEIGPGSHVVTFDGTGRYVLFSEPRVGDMDFAARSAQNLGGERAAQEDRAIRFSAEAFDEITDKVLEVAQEEGSGVAADLVGRLVRSRRNRVDGGAADSVASFSELAAVSRILMGVEVFAVPRG